MYLSHVWNVFVSYLKCIVSVILVDYWGDIAFFTYPTNWVSLLSIIASLWQEIFFWTLTIGWLSSSLQPLKMIFCGKFHASILSQEDISSTICLKISFSCVRQVAYHRHGSNLRGIFHPSVSWGGWWIQPCGVNLSDDSEVNILTAQQGEGGLWKLLHHWDSTYKNEMCLYHHCLSSLKSSRITFMTS